MVTEADPELGSASLSLGDAEIMLSAGERWVEPDGEHVIRSVEFDVIAGGATFDEALSKFIDGIFDFAVYLSELDDRADNEDEMFQLLAPRMLRVSRELERCYESRRKKPWISINLPRRRRSHEDGRGWHPSSRPLGSQRPSHA